MTFVLDELQVWCGVSLMGGTQLMMTDDRMIRHLLPFGGSDMMLSVNEWVADEANPAHDVHEFISSHIVPLMAIDFGVIDLRFPRPIEYDSDGQEPR